ncbi:MAG: hypothetical protein CBE08_004420 [Euryarchaeota archaeon TMED248]|nr:MAG: hypothetical protein CBE08_004420 [Euryarchaeota archaeon TMED248]|tara:strand:- start:69 stop:353 length:285 start_codon:yes stop_codon:yes gene_type:complete
MNSQQPIGEEDINEAIKAYGDNPSFLKKILEGSKTQKKVDNFLEGQNLAQNFNNPAGLPQDLYEAIMRQYGKEEFGPYTTDDMTLIQQYNKGLI